MIGQNNIQRAGVAIAVLLSVIVILLHNPLSGYETFSSSAFTELTAKPACKKELQEEFEKIRNEQLLISGAWKFMLSDDNRAAYKSKFIDGMSQMDRIKYESALAARSGDIREVCYEETQKTLVSPYPFDQWTTKGPIVDWLGSIVNVITSLFALVAAGAAWFFIFRSR